MKPTFGNLRFRHGSSARYDSDFAKDQPWVKITGKSKFDLQLWASLQVNPDTTLSVCSEFVDELPELDEIYSTTPNPKPKVAATNAASDVTTTQNPAAESPTGSIAVVTNVSDDPGPWTPRSLYSGQPLGPPVVTSRIKRRRTNESDRTSFQSVGQSPSAIPYHERTHSFAGSARTEDAIDSLLRAADFSEQPFAEQPDTPGVWPHASIQEACLMRYFIDELACWFDLCDPERHFALIVPQRARQCPALLNAIYTASARHLCRLDQYKKENAVEYLEKRLNDLHIETAVEYHSRCIEHLGSYSWLRLFVF